MANSFKEQLWILFAVPSGNCGIGKATRILYPVLSDDEATAVTQLEKWADEKTEITIEYGSASTSEKGNVGELNQKSVARILGMAYDQQLLQQEYAQLMEKLAAQQKKKVEQAKKTNPPVAKRSFIRKLTMEDDDEPKSPDMFKNSENDSPGDISDNSQSSKRSRISLSQSIDDNSAPNSGAQPLEDSIDSSAGSVVLTTLSDSDINLLEEIKKRDESIIELQKKLDSRKESVGENIQALITSAVQTALSGFSANSSTRGTNASAPAGSASSTEHPSNKVFLVKGYPLKVEQGALKVAVTYGSVGQTKKCLNLMISKLMEGSYTREYMSGRSLSGRKAPTRRVEGSPEIPTKPALPEHDVQALELFTRACWKEWFKGATPAEGFVRSAIRSKLSTEHRGNNRSAGKNVSANTLDQIRNNAGNLRGDDEPSDEES